MTEINVSDVPWKSGGLYGAMTYLIGLVTTGVWFYFDHLGTLLEFGVSQASTGEKVGLVVAIFYNSHSVVGDVPRLGGYASRGFITKPVYLAIPVVLLLLIAGAFVYSETDASGRLNAFLSGASLVVGYFVLFFVVMFALRSVAGPGFLPIGMTVVSGLLYPLALGGLAGLVAYEVKRVTGDSSPRDESRVGET